MWKDHPSCDVENKFLEVKWKQQDQLGGSCPSLGKRCCLCGLQWSPWRWRAVGELRMSACLSIFTCHSVVVVVAVVVIPNHWYRTPSSYRHGDQGPGERKINALCIAALNLGTQARGGTGRTFCTPPSVPQVKSASIYQQRVVSNFSIERNILQVLTMDFNYDNMWIKEGAKLGVNICSMSLSQIRLQSVI